MTTIVIFSACSLGTATSQNLLQLAIWRALLGIGMGGEWASGSTLVSETGGATSRQGDQHHAIGLGARLHLGRRLRDSFWMYSTSGQKRGAWVFAFGALPALVIVWIRRDVAEPTVWSEKARKPIRANTRDLFSPTYISARCWRSC